MNFKKINTALISVFHKKPLDKIIPSLKEKNINIISTGGTAKYLKQKGLNVISVENITQYEQILDGRVKTLHPKIFGSILADPTQDTHKHDIEKYKLNPIDLVIIDLYPFQETINNTNNIDEIIEMIDIGGIALIRAAAKNYKNVVIIPSTAFFPQLEKILKKGITSLEERKNLAIEAFSITSDYDRIIYQYLSGKKVKTFIFDEEKKLRYGENPHQIGYFLGNLAEIFTQLNGKELSYNNLLDIDAALNLITEFPQITTAIIKHTNPCGIAQRETAIEAFKTAFQSDPISAFGGIIVSNAPIDLPTAQEIDKIFYEILIAPQYEKPALELLTQKKKRIILKIKNFNSPKFIYKTALNGMLMQQKDTKTETISDLKIMTKREPSKQEISDMLFANKIVKHTKSNAIVLVKNKQLLGSGAGQPSRIDALKIAIEKAVKFGHNLKGAVMASDAFFPFPDAVELAHQYGITAVIQPGGSIRDNLSIEFCNKNNMTMAFTSIRHFKH